MIQRVLLFLQGLFGAFAKTLITLLKMPTTSRTPQSTYCVGNTCARGTASDLTTIRQGLHDPPHRPPPSFSSLRRRGAGLQPLSHPQRGLVISRRYVRGCQRVLQVPLQRHPHRGYSLCLRRSETHTHTHTSNVHAGVSSIDRAPDPPRLFQVSVTLLASSCTYQPTRATPARATTRRATPTAGPSISALCPSCWPRWWASSPCTCS